MSPNLSYGAVPTKPHQNTGAVRWTAPNAHPRDVIKQIVREVVAHPDEDPLELIRRSIAEPVQGVDRDNVEALIIEELRRLHDGVLARYGLRPSEFAQWQARQSQM